MLGFNLSNSVAKAFQYSGMSEVSFFSPSSRTYVYDNPFHMKKQTKQNKKPQDKTQQNKYPDIQSTAVFRLHTSLCPGLNTCHITAHDLGTRFLQH